MHSDSLNINFNIGTFPVGTCVFTPMCHNFTTKVTLFQINDLPLLCSTLFDISLKNWSSEVYLFFLFLFFCFLFFFLFFYLHWIDSYSFCFSTDGSRTYAFNDLLPIDLPEFRTIIKFICLVLALPYVSEAVESVAAPASKYWGVKRGKEFFRGWGQDPQKSVLPLCTGTCPFCSYLHSKWRANWPAPGVYSCPLQAWSMEWLLQNLFWGIDKSDRARVSRFTNF